MTSSKPNAALVQLTTIGVWTFASALPAILLTRFGLPMATIWFANAIAALLVVRRSETSLWAGLVGAAAGIFGANVAAGSPLDVSLAFTLLHLVEIGVTSTLLLRFVGPFPWAPGQIIRSLQVAMTAGPASAALLSAALLPDLIAGYNPLNAWTWFGGSACAAMLVFAAAWSLSEIDADAKVQPGKRAVIWGALLLTTLGVFSNATFPLLFLPPILLTYFGALGMPRQGVWGMLLVCATALYATFMGVGPINLIPATHEELRGLVLQGYVLALGLSTVPTGLQFMQMKTTVTALEASEAMATSANHAKSEFLATMSHELRTPIAGVSGYLDLMRDTPLTPAQARYLERMQTGVEHLQMVIGDVLDLSKIESGALELRAQPANLTALVSSCVSLIQGQVRDEVSVRAVIDPELPAFVIVDSSRLQQVLMNLLNNAAKFTEVGSVVLQARACAQREGWVEILVRDTGCGIPEEELQRVFERFRQVSQSRARSHGGAGLGLFIAQQIVWAMDGELELSSTVDLGTTVTVTLPLRAATEEPPLSARRAEQLDTPAPSLNLRVLLAEDDDAIRELMEIHLRRLGCAVVSCSDPIDALAEARAQRFDLLLSDLHMPGLDGYALLRRVRRARPALPAALLTADATPQVQQLAELSGFQRVLLKPIDPRELQALLSDPGLLRIEDSAPAEHHCVDRGTLDDLTLVMGERELERMLGQTLQRFTALVAELRAPQTLHARRVSIAHQIRGTASTLALSHVTGEATLLEDALSADDDFQERAASLERALKTTREALTELDLFTPSPEGMGQVIPFSGGVSGGAE